MLFFFDDFVLDTDRRELRRRSDAIAVQPQVFDLLEYLVRHRDRVATRDDLLEAVWHGRIVSESTLSSRINAARAAICDDGDSQRLIRTLPRKGIRFVADVREKPNEPPPPSTEHDRADTAAVPVGGTELPTIAVLPFDSMSGDPEDGYFADGMTEEIITALSRCSGMTVIARNSSFTFKGRAVDVRHVGRELGAGYVLEGSVRRGGETIRITAQLLDAASGAHLWADRFDGRSSDAFDVQDRIAESVVGVIEPRIRYAELDRARRKAPADLMAYELRLRAMALAGELTRASMDEAVRTLDRALALEPDNALVMATAAYYRAQCHFQGWVQEPNNLADEALRLAWMAVASDDQDSNVQWLAAFAVWTFARDAERARALFQRSLEANPNNAMALTIAGWVDNAIGNPAAARTKIERSIRLNPRHPRAWFMSTGMAISFIAERRFEDALQWAEKAVVQNRRSAVALRALAVALCELGRIDRARQVVQELLGIERELTVAILRDRLPFRDADLMRTYIDALRRAGLPE